MSSISFPHSSPGHLSQVSSPHDHDHEPSFYQNSFDAQSTSSFHINPLSSHPPRTPRSSLAFSFNSDTATSHEEEAKPATSVDVNDVDSDEGDSSSHPQKTPVTREDVWRELVKSSNGRDKTLKLIQYAMKMYLLFHAQLNRTRPSSKFNFTVTWDALIVPRLSSTVSGLSLARKCLLLFNWLAPLTVILAQQSVPYSTESTTAPSSKRKTRPLLHTFLHAPLPVVLELVHAAADDIYTFSLLGLFGLRTGDRARKFSDWCWFASTLVNLVENSVERSVLKDLQHEVEGRSYTESMTMGATSKSNPTASKIDDDELKRLHKQDYWLVMTRNKLLMDLIFVSYDCFGVKRAKAPVQVITGLASAILSTSKLYSREHALLAKSTKS